MRWYAEQRELQHARQETDVDPADQASFEQQLSNLQLSSPDESSAEVGSPDTRPAEAHGPIQRTDMGRSMRMPPQSSLQDKGLSSTRYSVDIPSAHLGAGATASQSSLRDRLFSSTRYTAPSEPQPAARTKDSKSRGLFSRVKSGFGKVFGGSGGEKSSGGSTSEVASSELRMDFAKRGRPAGQDMHPEDEARIEQFAEAVRGYEILPDGSTGRGDGRVCDGTLRTNLGLLRGFARWLRAENRGSMASRLLNDPESLAADIADYRAGGGDNHNRLKSALSHFRRFAPNEQELQAVGPGPRLMGRQIHYPYPEDAHLIDGLANEELNKLGSDSTSQRKGVSERASKQRRFSDWLQREGRGNIVSRLTGSDQQQRSLMEDYRDFTKAEGSVVVSFDRLRQYLGAEPQLKQHHLKQHHLKQHHLKHHHPYPDDARMIDGLANEELSKLGSDSTSQRKVFLNLASNQRKFSDWLLREGRGSIVSRITGSDQQKWSLDDDYRAFTKAEGRVAVSFDRLRQYLGTEPQLKHHHPYPDDARMIDGLANEERSKLGSDSASQRKEVSKLASNQRKFSDWLRTRGRGSIASRLNGSDQQKWSLKIDYQDFRDCTEALRGFSVGFKRLGQYLQVVEANAASGLSPQQASGRESAGPEGRLDQPTGFGSTWPPQQVDPSIQGRSELSLGREDWLGDEHIQRDYELLEQELQGNNPDLAARTRFVDPLIANYHLRLGPESVALSAFQRIVHNQNGNDTADFLFVPVNDASATDPDRRGTHWSLLFVDRSDRERPVAYHYDSFGGYNDKLAKMLAQRLGTRLEPVRMTRQGNGWDCGVFVVDGTRALVRRLAQRRPPAVLHLDNLVADRQQLQRRLRTAPSSARAAAAADRPGPSTQLVDSPGFWRGVDQAGQPPADSWNTANFWQDFSLPAHSPVQSVNPPSPPSWEQSFGTSIADRPGPSTQLVDSPEFWRGVDQAGQPPADSWNTANFWQDLSLPAHSPVQSVNPPPSWEQNFGTSIFAPQYMPPAQDLGGFVPPSWQHGNQPAPENLRRGMHWHNVLPNADRPQTHIRIHDVPYTATLGRSGKQNDIHVFLQ
ncbi:hypothetical protein IVA79_31180 [Bradyrhizobium sp. 138]|nr:Ulp1 family isopeptidase [Bradyrhizobium sp. 138]MCK1738334.1 hypothetical protein [Bradyrhizobium sp. 138]